MPEATVNFVFEKETKRCNRYQEAPEPGKSKIIGTLYLQKEFVGDAKDVTVTINAG